MHFLSYFDISGIRMCLTFFWILPPQAALLSHGAERSSSKISTQQPLPNSSLQPSPSSLFVLFFSIPNPRLGVPGLKTQKSYTGQAYCKEKWIYLGHDPVLIFMSYGHRTNSFFKLGRK